MKASGTGKGTMTVVTVYNAKVPEKENKCDNFDLKVDVEDVKMGESPSVPHVSSSCSHWPLPTSPPCPLMSPSTSLMSPVFPCPPYILLHVPLSLQIPMSPPGPSGSLHPPPLSPRVPPVSPPGGSSVLVSPHRQGAGGHHPLCQDHHLHQVGHDGDII